MTYATNTEAKAAIASTIGDQVGVPDGISPTTHSSLLDDFADTVFDRSIGRSMPNLAKDVHAISGGTVANGIPGGSDKTTNTTALQYLIDNGYSVFMPGGNGVWNIGAVNLGGVTNRKIVGDGSTVIRSFGSQTRHFYSDDTTIADLITFAGIQHHTNESAAGCCFWVSQTDENNGSNNDTRITFDNMEFNNYKVPPVCTEAQYFTDFINCYWHGGTASAYAGRHWNNGAFDASRAGNANQVMHFIRGQIRNTTVADYMLDLTGTYNDIQVLNVKFEESDSRAIKKTNGDGFIVDKCYFEDCVQGGDGTWYAIEVEDVEAFIFTNNRSKYLRDETAVGLIRSKNSHTWCSRNHIQLRRVDNAPTEVKQFFVTGDNTMSDFRSINIEKTRVNVPAGDSENLTVMLYRQINGAPSANIDLVGSGGSGILAVV